MSLWLYSGRWHLVTCWWKPVGATPWHHDMWCHDRPQEGKAFAVHPTLYLQPLRHIITTVTRVQRDHQLCVRRKFGRLGDVACSIVVYFKEFSVERHKLVVPSECDDVIKRAHVSRNREQQVAAPRGHYCSDVHPAKQPISVPEQILGRAGGGRGGDRVVVYIRVPTAMPASAATFCSVSSSLVS